MAGKANTTVRGRRLRSLLRSLREERGLSIEQVIQESGDEWVGSTLYRWEVGERIPRKGDLQMLLDVYGIHGEQRQTLLQLAREARRRGWWHKHGDAVPDWFQGFVGLEGEASAICAYQSEFIPGLLQTADYSRAVHKGALTSLSAEEIEDGVAVRQERQALMQRPDAPQLWFILNEGAIRRLVGGPEVMKAQLEHLLTMIDPPRVTAQILPYHLGAHPGMEGTFTILNFPSPEDSDLVYVEMQTRTHYIEEADETERYSLVFNHLRATALGTEQSLATLRAIVGEM